MTRLLLKDVRIFLYCIFISLIYFFLSDLENISNIAIQILEQKALCQQDPDQDEDEEPLEDQAEYDSVLISSVGVLVAALVTTLLSDFWWSFPEVLSSYCKTVHKL